MTIDEARKNIIEAENKFRLMHEVVLEIHKKAPEIRRSLEEEKQKGGLHQGASIEVRYPKISQKLVSLWEETKKSLPSGYEVSSDLLRHLSFNEFGDWMDMAERDIPRELSKLDEYKNRLALVEYLSTLHPKIARVTDIVLVGDYDAALKVVYTSLEAEIRATINSPAAASTFPEIGRAFKDGTLLLVENADGARSFLQGVIGYFRNHIAHKNLPHARNSIEACLSLFAIAHEAFVLLERSIPNPKT